MKILGVKFVPLNETLEKRLQTLVVASWLFIFAFGDILGLLLTAYLLLYTKTIRYFLIPYFLWMYYDWDTCNRGGRSELWTRLARNNILCRLFCNYFPIKLVKTVDLDPKKSYLFICMPHGILSTGVMGSLTSDVLDCKKLFPGLDMRVITMDQHFKIPVFRDCLYALGCCASNVESLRYLLSTSPKSPYTGRATILVVGGAPEAMEAMPGTYRVLVKRRKGFVKLALEHGTSLIPVVSFGETDLYDQIYRPEGSTFRRIQNYIRNFIGLAPVIFNGRGFFQYSFGFIPRQKPVTTVVGSPIEVPKIEKPTSEEINKYFEKFIKHLVEFFETQKYNYIKNAEKVTLDLL